MNLFAAALIYWGMVVFDLAVLAGSVWLIGWHDWSGWWMLLAVLICAGSNPKYLIATATGNSAVEMPK